MSKIILINDNVFVKDMLEEVNLSPANWLIDTNRQKKINVQKETQTINLVWGKLPAGTEPTIRALQASHLYEKTPLYNHYPSITNWLLKTFPKGLSRIAIIKLPPDGQVYPHTDFGEYYRARDRFHLVLSGEYMYYVDDESIHAKEGMLFWFDNNLVHHSKNISKTDRIAVVFDVEKVT